jgi:hypothetical protein
MSIKREESKKMENLQYQESFFFSSVITKQTFITIRFSLVSQTNSEMKKKKSFTL